MISLMRLVFASAALVIIYIDPSDPDRLVAATYTALALFTLYSTVIYFLSARDVLPMRLMHWIDMGWFLLLVALSSGTGSIFFSFFFFSILVASFRMGFAEGLRVTMASAVSFPVVGYFTSPGSSDFELNRFLLRPVSLLCLGYMISYWGGMEIESKRRLQLLRDVSRLSNPRFGIERTLASICMRVREFYDADTALLLLADPHSSSYFFYRSERGQAEPVSALRLAPDATRPLLALLSEFAGVHCGRPRTLWQRLCDLGQPADDGSQFEECERLAELLGADSFITLPVRSGGQAVGRVYVTCRRRRFGNPHKEFLQQVIEQVTPVIENIVLLDRMATDAAYQERQKISRDIHDSTIQPYIGLKFALGALRRKIGDGEPLAAHVDELIDKADEGIDHLRNYVGALKGEKVSRDSILLPAVLRQAERFQKFYGIKVEVEAPEQFSVNDRLAAETFQIINEGLSNIRRHTQAGLARIVIESADSLLRVRIENDGASLSAATFVPRSVTERALALGGRAAVDQRDGRTAVSVEIPL